MNHPFYYPVNDNPCIGRSETFSIQDPREIIQDEQCEICGCLLYSTEIHQKRCTDCIEEFGQLGWPDRI